MKIKNKISKIELLSKLQLVPNIDFFFPQNFTFRFLFLVIRILLPLLKKQNSTMSFKMKKNQQASCNKSPKQELGVSNMQDANMEVSEEENEKGLGGKTNYIHEKSMISSGVIYLGSFSSTLAQVPKQVVILHLQYGLDFLAMCPPTQNNFLYFCHFLRSRTCCRSQGLFHRWIILLYFY